MSSSLPVPLNFNIPIDLIQKEIKAKPFILKQREIEEKERVSYFAKKISHNKKKEKKLFQKDLK